MKPVRARKYLAEYIEGTLSRGFHQQIEQVLADSEELRAELEELKLTRKAVKTLAEHSAAPSPAFSASVMQKIENPDSNRRRIFTGNWFNGPVAALATACVLLLTIIISEQSTYQPPQLVASPTPSVQSLPRTGSPRSVVYNDDRIASSTNVLLMHIEGSFGMLLMVVFGLIGIITLVSTNRKKHPLRWKIGVLFIILAVCVFFFRSTIGTFFNDVL